MTDQHLVEVREKMDKVLRDQIHLFCALADALARSNALSKVDLLAAVRSKLEWLTRAAPARTPALPRALR